MSIEREKKLEETLAQFIQPMKNIPFEVVIRGLYGTTVEKFDQETENNQEILDQIAEAMRKACRAVQASPIERPRPNEVGNDIEPFVIKALCAETLNAFPPRTKAGKGKSTGYPDIKIETANLPIYLEVKTFAASNYSTTQRSFYLSPTDDPKVTDNAYHLLVGFEIVRNGNSFTPVAFEIVDLYGLDCDMKFESNSDNKRLYQDDRILVREKIGPAQRERERRLH